MLISYVNLIFPEYKAIFEYNSMKSVMGKPNTQHSLLNFSFTVSFCVWPVNKSLSVQIGEKAVLCCPVLPPTSKLVMITWEVILRGKLLCRLSYKPDTKETATPSCTNGRITWASRPDRNPHLQIDAVAVTHDGLYSCDIVTADGNYRLGYNLQVLGKDCPMP
jgi:hypothetical protein